MKTLGWTALAVVLATTAACGGEVAEDDVAEVESGLSRRLDTGRIIVRFKTGTSASSKASVHRAHGATKKKALASGAEVVTVARGSTQSVLARYKGNANVQWAEVDALVPHDHTTVRRPNDPYLSYQWQHDALLAPSAWSLGTGSADVLLAVCDTGISPNHPDLAASLRMDLCFNTVHGRAGDCDPVDWHGTGVAGAAAAIGNDGVGVAGTAWTAGIIPVRVSNELDGTAYISDMADCLTYAADQGADVINLSYQTYDAGTIYKSILDAAAYAETKGAITFVASGNEGTNAVTSQDPTNLVYVGATDATNARASFSNYGAFVDVVAPGDEVVVPGVQVSCADANGNGVVDRGECSRGANEWYSASGTSFASPIAAGAAVLLKALKPSATPADIRSALYTTAKDLGIAGGDAYYGTGLIDLHAAAHKLLGTTTTTTNSAPSVVIREPGNGASGTTGVAQTFSASATDAQDGDISARTTWTFGDGTTATGASVTKTWSSAGSHTVTARVTDAGGLSASASTTFTVSAPVVNAAPRLSSTEPTTATLSVTAGASVRFVATAWDPEQGDLTSSITWSVPGGTANGGSIAVTFATAGTFTVTCRVADAAGLSASQGFTITVTSATTTTTTLLAPTNLRATQPARRTVRLTWTDDATNESAYSVERLKVGVGVWSRVASLGANATGHTDSPTKGTWRYRVRVHDATTSVASGYVEVFVR